MLLADVARVSGEVAATSSRSRKTALLAGLFREAGPYDVPIAIPYLAGRLPQRRIGVGWSTLRHAPPRRRIRRCPCGRWTARSPGSRP
ncbi:hypothetical protein GCM10020000_68450 [Streptomyces olivoverticillatus]